MTTLRIDVAGFDAVKASMQSAFRGEPQGCAYTFPDEGTLLSTLTPPRWAIVRALTGAGPLEPRELARRLHSDADTVQADARALVNCGLIDRTAEGQLHLPYDEVRLELVAKAA
ncbi:putative transcriptional regulator [Thiorhodovibrio winogradskyi]|uniref:Transcriptional regulator n=1 Tax=Thiorhodovibrio winogradskyi TaxID=77007 RepID=A0ABZ0S5M3_9GAMM|nr:MarR family transcriptional regulator [Thiorhodovibrio winogradskyi]